MLKTQHFLIDINQKNLLIISYPEDCSEGGIEPKFLDMLTDEIGQWISQKENPIFVFVIPDKFEIKLERIESD